MSASPPTPPGKAAAALHLQSSGFTADTSFTAENKKTHGGNDAGHVLVKTSIEEKARAARAAAYCGNVQHDHLALEAAAAAGGAYRLPSVEPPSTTTSITRRGFLEEREGCCSPRQLGSARGGGAARSATPESAAPSHRPPAPIPWLWRQADASAFEREAKGGADCLQLEVPVGGSGGRAHERGGGGDGAETHQSARPVRKKDSERVVKGNKEVVKFVSRFV